MAVDLKSRGSGGVVSSALLFLVLFGAWLLWSGIYKPLLVGLGVFSCLLCAWLASRVGFFRYPGLVRALPRLPAYWLWVLKDIILSSIEVARLILRPGLPISPTMVELDATELTEAGQVVLGNSITLSPGTVTLDVFEGKVKVHCLTQSAAADLASGDAVSRVRSLGGN